MDSRLTDTNMVCPKAQAFDFRSTHLVAPRAFYFRNMDFVVPQAFYFRKTRAIVLALVSSSALAISSPRGRFI